MGRSQKGPDNRVVQGVTGQDAFEPADDGRPEDEEIANRIEGLMADEFVRPAQTLSVQDLVAVNHYGVVHRAAPGQAHGPQGLDLMQEAEGAAVGKLATESVAIHLQVHSLPADGAGGEGDLEGDFEAVRRTQGGAFVALDHLDHVEDLNVPTRRSLKGQTRGVEPADEVEGGAREGAYVHGLSLQGARWDVAGATLERSKPKEMFCKMPVINVQARAADRVAADVLTGYYTCPCYKTEQVRLFSLPTSASSFARPL